MGDALAIDDLAERDVGAVVTLWINCDLVRPWNDARGDIARALANPNSTVLAARLDGMIVGAVMVGHDGHRGWIYYLAVDPTMRGRGYGRLIVAAAERWLTARDIPKVMLMVRPENTEVRAFYEAAGYFDQPRAVFAKWLDGRPPTP
jgi:hypothetical protein